MIDRLFRSKVYVVQNEIKLSRDNGKEKPPFFCVSVPKKYFSRAVDRNKVRRRIKSVLNHLKISVSGNFLITYNNYTVMSYQKIEKTLTDIFMVSK